jgi:hypothetical protein
MFLDPLYSCNSFHRLAQILSGEMSVNIDWLGRENIYIKKIKQKFSLENLSEKIALLSLRHNISHYEVELGWKLCRRLQKQYVLLESEVSSLSIITYLFYRILHIKRESYDEETALYEMLYLGNPLPNGIHGLTFAVEQLSFFDVHKIPTKI